MTIGINTGMQLLRNFFEIPLTFNRTHSGAKFGTPSAGVNTVDLTI